MIEKGDFKILVAFMRTKMRHQNNVVFLSKFCDGSQMKKRKCEISISTDKYRIFHHFFYYDRKTTYFDDALT